VYDIIKDGRRRRYIGFVIKVSTGDQHIERFEIIGEIKRRCRQLFSKDCKELGIYLTRFDGEKGIVRCNHIEKENTIKLLKSIRKIYSHEVEIETLGTSGTIKSLMKKHMEK